MADLGLAGHLSDAPRCLGGPADRDHEIVLLRATVDSQRNLLPNFRILDLQNGGEGGFGHWQR